MIGIQELLAAFTIGLMGSLHCVGMCGGISGALTTALGPSGPGRTLAYTLLYNSGRLGSYALAGALAGLLGSVFHQLLGTHGPSALRIVAGTLMILLGLYLGGWWRLLRHLEQAGAHVWKRLAPLSRRFIPVDRPHKALLLGALWGWLPCGLVYSALAWAVGAGNAGTGALLMLSFGLGTLPALLGVSLFSRLLRDLAQTPQARQLAALLLIAFGLWTLATQLPLLHTP